MNLNIQKLATKSGVVIHTTLGKPVNLDELERFAELIIKECITQIALIGISNFENDEHGDIGWTVDTSIEMIKEHFGVEE